MGKTTTSYAQIIIITALSMLIHASTLTLLPAVDPLSQKTPMKVTIVDKSKPIVAPPTSPPEKKLPPKKKSPPKLPRPAPPQPPTQPVQGLQPNSLTPDAKGVSAPLGNTLMAEDTGKRLRADQIKPLSGDLSRDPKLIRASVQIPTYTNDAIDAAIEGVFIVDVFVEADGHVSAAELRKKIGHGMDVKLLSAAQAARYEPRLDAHGGAISGWTEMKFLLQIP